MKGLAKVNNPFVRGAVAITLIICATVMAITGHMTETAFVGLATLMLGYTFGKASNGYEGLVKLALAAKVQPAPVPTAQPPDGITLPTFPAPSPPPPPTAG